MFVQVHDHPGKILGIREPEMVLRLHGAGNDAEHIFRRVGHAHHSVGFQLGKVDDGVRFVQIGGVLDGFCHFGLGTLGCLLLKIVVQHRAGCLDLMHSGGLVYPVYIDGGIQSSGTVADDHFRAPFFQQLRQGAEQVRVGGRRGLRLQKGDQICLDRHLHSGSDPVQTAERGQHFQKGCPAARYPIFRAWDNGYFCHNASCFLGEIVDFPPFTAESISHSPEKCNGRLERRRT